MEDKEHKKGGAAIGGLIFVGCMFIGGGIGMIFDAEEVGGAIGRRFYWHGNLLDCF